MEEHTVITFTGMYDDRPPETNRTQDLLGDLGMDAQDEADAHFQI